MVAALQNDFKELWALLSWAVPDCVSDLRQFEEYYVDPLKLGQRSNASEYHLGKVVSVQVLCRVAGCLQVATSRCRVMETSTNPAEPIICVSGRACGSLHHAESSVSSLNSTVCVRACGGKRSWGSSSALLHVGL